MHDWTPSSNLEHLRARAQMLSQIRAFFAQRNVLEVTTPILGSTGVTDPFIDNFTTNYQPVKNAVLKTLYLQTSPEYAMKRLLASGSGCIYQINAAFRHEDFGRLHNPEFTLLEWYRVSFNMQALIDEVKSLIMSILPVENIHQCTYQKAFEQYLKFNPLDVSKDDLYHFCTEQDVAIYADSCDLEKDDLLQLLFTSLIEPHFANDSPVIVTHFPASQASLAKLCEENIGTALRFELYYKGIELANGFEELTDADEQRARFQQDNQKRQLLGLEQKPLDEKLLMAIKVGLPSCSGVAMGVDRLLMLLLGLNRIDQVISFSHDKA